MYEDRARLLVNTIKTEVEFLLELDEDQRMEYAREIVDSLIGTDETAVIRGVGPIGESLVEQLSDMLTELILAQLTKVSG